MKINYLLFFKLFKLFLLIILIAIGYFNIFLIDFSPLNFLLDVSMIIFGLLVIFIHDYVQPACEHYLKYPEVENHARMTDMNRHNDFWIIFGILLLVISIIYRFVFDLDPWVKSIVWETLFK